MSKPVVRGPGWGPVVPGAAILGLLALPGCGADAPSMSCGLACNDLGGHLPDLAVQGGPSDLAGTTNTKLIFNRLLLPDPGTPSLAFKYDIDGSGRQRNQLGLVLSTLQTLGGVNPQATVDDALTNGEVIQLLQLTSADPDLRSDPAAVVSGWVGTAPEGTRGADLFTGKAKVDVSVAEEPDPHVMVGTLVDGRLSTGHSPAAAMPLRFPLPGQKPVLLTIYGVHVEGELVARGTGGYNLGVSKTGSWAMFAGGISATQIHERLVPAVAALLQSIIDGGGVPAMQVANFFDDNGDGKVTAAELEQNATVQSLLTPDEDLFDANGTLAPNQDGVRDSLSFGLGFTALPVTFPDQP